MKISREVKTAVLVISGIVLFIYLFNYLKGENLFDSNITYYTKFDYNALDTSSPVTIKGNTVGKISSIEYDYESGKTIVGVSVDKRLKFSKNSVIRLYEVSLMGGNALSIIPSEDGDMAQKGDFLPSEIEPGLVKSLSKNFSGLSDNLDGTLKSADSLLTNLNKIVVDDSENGLKAILKELNATLKGFKALSYSINSLVTKNDENISGILENFKTVSQDLTQLSAELKDANLGESVVKLDATLASVNTLMAGLEQGEGSMGKLLKDDALYNNLEGATKEMEALLRDIKLHPKRYFRILSKKEIPYQEPKD
ncbi:phospholipid/cholesterol/gamma-HCH transport system substrate-binding protein [Flavobacteriaceae bacterium MAR_2010_72]|nr:phospholipid/cholesterol/gamma-HCH transport system substrate-binding protein [Flavobacteriaceae bacterium MAR_2010_72]TVZ59671.1 phospholipid/cholesterol/gamma-HCH transport system substrate-binding protein [Flavobacteriaceae bacterium MAR_2010_105]